MKEPFVPLWLVAISSESGTILCKAAVEKLPEKKFTTEIPAECGPYTMAEWQPKQKVILKANPNWQGTKPAFSEVHIIDVEENKAAELAYEAGEIESPTSRQTPLPATSRHRRRIRRMLEIAGPFCTWMGMNTEHEKLNDIRVRKAIQRAIDVDSILQAAYAGSRRRPMASCRRHVGARRARNTATIRTRRGRCWRRRASPISTLELKTLNQQDRLVASQIIQTNLADVGIKVEIMPLDRAVLESGPGAEGEDWKTLQLWLMRYRTSPDPADMIQWFV